MTSAYSDVIFQPLTKLATLTPPHAINFSAGASTRMIITPEIACRLFDSTAEAIQLDNGWFILGDRDQPLGIEAGHLDGIEDIFPTEAEAWQAAEHFLLDRIPLNAA